jgi:hypothetical protein
MPAERLSMRKIRELLRLRLENRLPQRAIAESRGLSQGAISTYLSRARAAGVGWPIPEELDDARLEALLFPPLRGTPADQRPMPNWAWVHRELRRPNVTLAFLWEEYRAGAPDGFGYSWVLRSLLARRVRQMSAPDRRALVDRDHRAPSIRRQCALLGVGRSGVYRPLRPAKTEGHSAKVRLVVTMIVRSCKVHNCLILWTVSGRTSNRGTEDTGYFDRAFLDQAA